MHGDHRHPILGQLRPQETVAVRLEPALDLPALVAVQIQGAVEHLGDNLTGAGDGDDEQIKVDLSLVPENIQRVAFTVTIYDADVRRQNFGQVNNAFIRIVDESNGQEILRYDLGEDFSIETAAIFGELYKHNGEWKFNAIGSGYQGGLAALCANYGVEVED